MGESKHVRIICVAAALLVSTGSVIGWAQAADSPAPKWTKAELDKGYVVFTCSTLARLQPDYVPARRAVVGTVSCALARGEYKSLQIGIHGVAGDLPSVRLELESDLEARIYRPIDEETGKLLLGYENPVPDWIHPWCLDGAGEIASIGKGKTSFFWLTLHAGESAAAGKHRGKIRIPPEGRPVTKLDLAVTVRPFRLQRARIAYAPFFYVEYQGIALPKFAQTEEWLGAIFRDMAEHSHTSAIGLIGVPGAAIDFSTLPPPENRTFSMLLPLAKQAGLTSPDIPVILMSHNMESPASEGGDDREAEERCHGLVRGRATQAWLAGTGRLRVGRAAVSDPISRSSELFRALPRCADPHGHCDDRSCSVRARRCTRYLDRVRRPDHAGDVRRSPPIGCGGMDLYSQTLVHPAAA